MPGAAAPARPGARPGLEAGAERVRTHRDPEPGARAGGSSADLAARGAYWRAKGLTDAQVRHELQREGFKLPAIAKWLRGEEEPPAEPKPDAASSSTPAPSSTSSSTPASKPLGQTAPARWIARKGGTPGGLMLALFVYPMTLAYLREGPDGLGRWFRAKFLNQTSTDPGIFSQTSFGPRGPAGASPAVATPATGGGGTQAAAYVPGGSSSTPGTGGRARVRTGTYNVHQSTSARQTEADLVKLGRQADVISLQEIQGGGHSTLGAWLRSRGWGFYKSPGETAVAWNASRYDLLEQGHAAINPVHFGKSGLMHRQAAYVLLRDKATGQRFWQVSVHTAPAGDAQHQTGTPAQRRAIQAEQGRNMQALYDRLARTGIPVFFAGDMAKATSSISGSIPDSGHTRIDQLVSQLRTQSRHVVKGLFSDHNAVLATYSIGSGPAPRRPAAGGGGSSSAGGASAAARGAVAFARAHIGDPYQWGGNGPHRWDCSGLIKAAYAREGVHLPRTSTAMLGSGHRVSRSQLRVGDLVWPHLGHVQLCSGPGRVIEAPHTGANVREVALGHVWAARRVA